MTSPLNLAIYSRSAAFRAESCPGPHPATPEERNAETDYDLLFRVKGGLPEPLGKTGGAGPRKEASPAETGASGPLLVRTSDPGMVARSAVTLEQARASLCLFGKGLCSKYLQAKPLEDASPSLANTWRPFPFSNGKEIFLPAVLDVFEDRRDNWRAFRLYAAVQAGQWEAGTFDLPRGEGAWPGGAGSAAKALEDPLAFLRHFLRLFPRPGLASEIFLYLESARVLSFLSRRYRGLAADISWFLPRLRAPLEPLDHRCVLWNLYFDLLQPLSGFSFEGYPPEIREAACAVVGPGATLRETLACTYSVYRLLAPLCRRSPSSFAGLLSAEEGVLGAEGPDRLREGHKAAGKTDGEGARGADFADEVHRILGADFLSRRLPSGLGGFLRPDTLGKKVGTEEGSEERSGKERARPGTGPDREAGETERRLSYPEWDYLAGGYRRDWTTLHQIRPREGEEARLSRLLEEWDEVVREVSLQFRMLRYQDRTWRKKLEFGEEIDIQEAVDWQVALRCGLPPSEKVYMEKRRVTREVSALFLLDLSASTSSPLHEGTHAGETVLELILASVAVMARALEQLGDRYGIYGFSGYGKDRVEFMRIKSFDEALDEAAWRRLAGLKPMRSTRMGTAVRHAHRLLDAESSSLKLMLLLSDGYPQDFDYGEDRTDREYGLRDTAQALREAEAGRIVPFCVTVDAAGHDYLRRMYPPHGYLVVRSVEDLPRQLPKVYLRLRGG